MTLAKRRDENRELLREEILDAARQLFVRDGYDATSIRAIAAKAGCSVGILYHYFEDKPAIMARLVRETFARMQVRLTAIREDSAPVADRLRRGMRAYIEFGLEYPHHYALLFMNAANWETKSAVQEAFAQDGLATFACMKGMAEEAIAAGVVRPELNDSDELAQSLWVAIHGLVSLQIGCGGFPFIERSRLMDRLVDILLAGVLKS